MCALTQGLQPGRLERLLLIAILLLLPYAPSLMLVAGATEQEESSSSSSCVIAQEDGNCLAKTAASSVGHLRPQDLPSLQIFNVTERRHLVLNEGKRDKEQYNISTGQVWQINRVKQTQQQQASTTAAASVTHVTNLVDRDTVQTILNVLATVPALDVDPDTVDGMPTYEIFVDSPELNNKENQETTKVLDVKPESIKIRKAIRQKLQTVLQPILEQRITPLVRHLYAEVCGNSTSNDRACTPCYSLIRHYRHGQRQSHATHHDGHALATVVVSLSDFDQEYRGGLYVATGYGHRQFLPLKRGDGAIHRSFLLHGVQVLDLPSDKAADTERWSWILWYRDSTSCIDHSHEWFADCAMSGDAVCQQLHATKVGNIPGLTPAQVARQVLEWNQKSALGGAGMAAVKMARAHLKLLPSDLAYDETAAAKYYNLAIQSRDPDGYYGMAGLLLLQLQSGQGDASVVLNRVVGHLEAAAQFGHVFAMFNLGMVHTFGYGVANIDTDLAVEWFVASGLPEGYYVAYFQAAVVGDQARMQNYQERAQQLGMDQPWRKQARQQTGSGGAGGVDLNLPWPPSADGRLPPVL